LLLLAFGEIWFVAFFPLQIAGLLLRRLFQDTEIPLDVKTGTAWFVSIALLAMLGTMAFCHHLYSHGWR
jgi:flagellar biosynthesis protein FliR